MKDIYQLRNKSLLLLGAITSVLLASCGSYQATSYDDGIYSSDKPVATTETVVVKDNANAKYYEDYFGKTVTDYGEIVDDEVFTDVDSYSSQTVVAQEEVATESYSAWEDAGDNVTINVYNTRPYYYSNWRRFNYWGNYYNDWAFCGPSWGWSYYNYGNFGYPYNYYGYYGNPYYYNNYGYSYYGRRNYGYINGRRGYAANSYYGRNSNRRALSSRRTSAVRSTPRTTPRTKPRTIPRTKPRTTPRTKPRTTPRTKPRTNPRTKPRTTPRAKPRTTPRTRPRSTPRSAPRSTPRSSSSRRGRA